MIDGIPLIKSFGFSGDNNVLVMELLGKSLEDLFQKQGGRFSMKTVCMLGNQIVYRDIFIYWYRYQGLNIFIQSTFSTAILNLIISLLELNQENYQYM